MSDLAEIQRSFLLEHPDVDFLTLDQRCNWKGEIRNGASMAIKGGEVERLDGPIPFDDLLKELHRRQAWKLASEQKALAPPTIEGINDQD